MTAALLELTPSTTTLRLQSLRKLFIQAFTLQSIVYHYSFTISLLWPTLSKASKKSSIHRSVWRPWCMLLTMSLTISSSCVSHDLCGQNPCWMAYRIPCWSACFIIALQMMCSMSLDAVHVKLIGWSLAHRYFWPFLKTVMLLTNQYLWQFYSRC